LTINSDEAVRRQTMCRVRSGSHSATRILFDSCHTLSQGDSSILAILWEECVREGLELLNVPETEKEFAALTLRNNLLVIRRALSLLACWPKDPLQKAELVMGMRSITRLSLWKLSSGTAFIGNCAKLLR
jgi:hypothetical protein